MTQTTDAPTAPVRGAYLVDTSAALERDGYSVVFWIGRMRYVRPDGSYLLVAARGDEWAVAPADARPASAVERVAYERHRASGYLCGPGPAPGDTRDAS